MFINKRWINIENVNIGEYKFKQTKWSGWFLFNFIPLKIWTESYYYARTLKEIRGE